MGEPFGKLYKLFCDEEQLYLFYCPGCKKTHPFRVKGDGPSWTFNGDSEKPTFEPSLLVNKHDPASRCHLFLRNGELQYCGDCHHDLAGKTIPLPEFRWHDHPTTQGEG